MARYKSFDKTHPKLRLSRAKVHSALCLKWSHIIHTWETDNVHNWFIHSIQIQHTYLRNIIQTHIWFIIGNMSTMFCNPKYLIFITNHKYLLITGEKKAAERRIGQCWRNAVKCKMPSTRQWWWSSSLLTRLSLKIIVWMVVWKYFKVYIKYNKKW